MPLHQLQTVVQRQTTGKHMDGTVVQRQTTGKHTGGTVVQRQTTGKHTDGTVVQRQTTGKHTGGACLQVVAWSCSAVPVRRLSTRHGRGMSTSQVFRRLHMCRPTDTVTDWRQEFLCSRTTAMNNLPTEIRRRGTNFEDYRQLLKAFLFV